MSANNIIPAVLAPLTLGAYGVYKDSKEQKKKLQQELDLQKNAAAKQEFDLITRKKQEDVRRRALGSLAQSSLKSSFMKSGNYGGTLRTSPLGLIGSTGSGPKKLIGE